MSTHFHPLTIKNIRRETKDCVSIAFDIPAELAPEYLYKPGQNITLRINIDGEEIRRSYSICSSPSDNELRVAIKEISTGKFSLYANKHLREGDQLDLLPPSGKFFAKLDPSNQKNYLAFAAGSGITPVLSMIKSTLEIEKHSNYTLIYGNRNRGSIIFREQLEALKNRYIDRLVIHHVLSRERTDAPINHGRIDASKCEAMEGKLINVDAADEIFLCGPNEMIFSVKDWLEAKNVNPRKVHFELFLTPGSTLIKSATLQETDPSLNGKLSAVTIKLDGISFGFNLPYYGQSILDAALEQGADLPFACKGGVCATCRARVTEGAVEMTTNYALEPDELEQGFILSCQSHPRTEKVMIDFDSK